MCSAFTTSTPRGFRCGQLSAPTCPDVPAVVAFPGPGCIICPLRTRWALASAETGQSNFQVRMRMGATLVLAIWIASASTYQAALPFAGEYQIREYANSDSGIDDFMKWVDTPGHDKIDLICVAISGGEASKAAQFWRQAEVKRIFFMNPL